MGTVYRAVDRLTRQHIALQRIDWEEYALSLSSTRTLYPSRGELNLALANEYKTLASLRHPHIISVLDYGFDADHQPYFTMDLLENAQTLLKTCTGKPMEQQI